MKKIFVLMLFLVAICVNTNAQKFYYEGGYFEKSGSQWFEYKPSQKDGVWNSFTEVDNQEYYYVIDNGLCQVAVPKSTKYNFLIMMKGESEWKFKYKSVRSEETYRTPNVHARLQELVNQQNEALKATPVIVSGLKVEHLQLTDNSIWFGYRDTKNKKKHYSASTLDNWRASLRAALIEQLKSFSTSDEMTRLCIEGGYTFCYDYCDKDWDSLFPAIKISPNEIK